MKKNVLLTGAKGQLGNDIQLLASQYPGFNFHFTDVDTLDLTDRDAVERYISANAIHYIVNCAAYTAVDKAEEDADRCFLVNSQAVANIAKASAGRAKLIHISTDYVFPGTTQKPLKETDPTDPQSVYGRSKLEGERVLQELNPDSIIIRTAWLYSVFGNNFVKTMIRLGKEKDSLRVVADQYGTPTYSGDLAKAILDIISFSEGDRFVPGIYHYSNEGVITWFEFASRIMSLAGLNCQVDPIPTSEYPTPARRPMYSVLDKSKIKETFNLTIPAWEDSLKTCIAKL